MLTADRAASSRPVEADKGDRNQMSEIHHEGGSPMERLQALGLDLPGVVATRRT